MCGLVLRAPKGDRVRPTQDRVREAVFSMLGAKVPGARTLDLFAGTGALGLEAASRGAASVAWVEQDKRVVEVLRQNAALLEKSACVAEVVCDEAARFLKRIAGDVESRKSEVENRLPQFDLVFADPPYEWVARAGWQKTMDALAAGVLAEGGLFIAEQSADQPAWSGEGWDLLRDKAYGGTRVCMYRKKENTDGIGA